MGSRAVKRFGRAGGEGAVGSEGEDNVADQSEQNPTTVAPMTGGPDPAQTPMAPSFQPFTYGGRTFQSEGELGAYLEELHGQINTLQTRPPAPPTVTPPVAPSPAPAGAAQPTIPKRIEDMDSQELLSLVLADPKAFATAIKHDMRQEYMVAEQSRENIRNFWSDFWKDNPELKKFESTVQLVFNGNLKTLGPLQMSEVGPRLAEMARGTVLSINKDAFGGGSRQNGGRQSGANVVEGGGNAASVARTEPQEPEQPRTLSAIIKSRQRQRSMGTAQPPAKAS